MPLCSSGVVEKVSEVCGMMFDSSKGSWVKIFLKEGAEESSMVGVSINSDSLISSVSSPRDDSGEPS